MSWAKFRFRAARIRSAGALFNEPAITGDPDTTLLPLEDRPLVVDIGALATPARPLNDPTVYLYSPLLRTPATQAIPIGSQELQGLSFMSRAYMRHYVEPYFPIVYLPVVIPPTTTGLNEIGLGLTLMRLGGKL